MKRTLTFAAALTLGAAALMPLPSLAQSGLNIIVTSAPPAARYESIPAPRDGYVWAPGYWNWENNRHAWIAGRWEASRNGYQYQRAQWQRANDGWRLNQGGWQQLSERSTNMIRVAPPRDRYERMPRARPGYVWSAGHWAWRGNRHEWVRGTWLRARPGYAYMSPSWSQRDGQWYLEEARWERERRGRDRDRNGVPDRIERDRDRDGVADAYDRDRDNDGVRNRNDADRDGDGYRNDRDRFPDDPARY